MQVNSVDGFKNSPSFSGVFFVNKEAIVKAGNSVVKELLENEAVKKYTKRVDYDLFIRRNNDVTEWQVLTDTSSNLKNLPWVPILDSSSLTKSSVMGYITKFLKNNNSNSHEMKYFVPDMENSEMLNKLELVENASKYIKDMMERVDWLD